VHELVVQFEDFGEPRRKRLLLRCDGVLVWAPEIEIGDSVEVAAIGRNLLNGLECASNFAGTITSVQQNAAGRDPVESGGNLRLRVRLSPGLAGQCDPLVVTGRTGAGDLLGIQYMDATSVRFGFDHWGSPMAWSDPVTVDFSQPVTLEVAMPSLNPVEDALASGGIIRGDLLVSVNGRVVWQEVREFYPAEAGEIVIGRNPIGGTSSGPTFRGEVLAAERRPRE
jgi:hypothetical protein